MSLLSLLNGEYPYDLDLGFLEPQSEAKTHRPPISIKVPPPPQLDITAQSSPLSDVGAFEIPGDAVPAAIDEVDVRPTQPPVKGKKKSHARKQPEGHIARPRNA